MKIAVIKTGGKQYTVAEKTRLKVEKLPGAEGQKVEFDEVLLVADGETVTVGAPTVSGAKVIGTIVKQARAPKIDVVKYKAKIRYHKKTGHRQRYTEVTVDSIA
ncbi:50S ribosomal protein L21 [Candidatus Falkowbacteria bacterium]|nr:50S ribosomal protein L21 [Candidatus Falkowbacteria bacterium]